MGSTEHFVRPETVSLTISSGDTLTVKKRLTSGEQRAAYARIYITKANGDIVVNPLLTGLAQVEAYLVDWTLTDHAGRPVPIKGLSVDELESVLDNLSSESFKSILTAIEQHETAMLAERAKEKNALDGVNESSAISPSPVG